MLRNETRQIMYQEAFTLDPAVKRLETYFAPTIMVRKRQEFGSSPALVNPLARLLESNKGYGKDSFLGQPYGPFLLFLLFSSASLPEARKRSLLKMHMSHGKKAGEIRDAAANECQILYEEGFPCYDSLETILACIGSLGKKKTVLRRGFSQRGFIYVANDPNCIRNEARRRPE